MGSLYQHYHITWELCQKYRLILPIPILLWGCRLARCFNSLSRCFWWVFATQWEQASHCENTKNYDFSHMPPKHKPTTLSNAQSKEVIYFYSKKTRIGYAFTDKTFNTGDLRDFKGNCDHIFCLVNKFYNILNCHLQQDFIRNKLSAQQGYSFIHKKEPGSHHGSLPVLLHLLGQRHQAFGSDIRLQLQQCWQHQ